jgi:hypothetical protein
MLAREWGLSVGCWPENGVFQWDAGPSTGSFSGMLARARGLSVECWPEHPWGLLAFSGKLAQEWGLVLTVLGVEHTR